MAHYSHRVLLGIPIHHIIANTSHTHKTETESQYVTYLLHVRVSPDAYSDLLIFKV